MVVESTMQRTAPVNRNWLVAGVLVTSIALLVGGTFLVLSLFRSATPTDEPAHLTYQHPITRIDLDVDAGDIALSAGEAGQVVVERRLRWRKAKPEITAEWNGDTLRLSSRCREEKNCTVNYTVRVPAGVTVRAHTIDGDVSVRDIAGELDLKSSSGDIGVQNSTGPVRVNGESGNVTGTLLRSTEVDVQSTDGDVVLAFAVVPTAARVVLTAGAIRIAVPRAGSGVDGYHVQATTKDGQRRVGVDEDSAGKHSIHAELVDGDVTVSYA